MGLLTRIAARLGLGLLGVFAAVKTAEMLAESKAENVPMALDLDARARELEKAKNRDRVGG